MKRFLFISLLLVILFACSKTPSDTVYDSHLFQQLQAHDWIFDSAHLTDSLNNDTTVYASDTALQVTKFTSGLYTIRNVRDTVLLDSAVYQAIYNTPDKIYYYSEGGQVLSNQYITIDTVNTEILRLSRLDSLSTYPSLIFYHAQ